MLTLTMQINSQLQLKQAVKKHPFETRSMFVFYKMISTSGISGTR